MSLISNEEYIHQQSISQAFQQQSEIPNSNVETIQHTKQNTFQLSEILSNEQNIQFKFSNESNKGSFLQSEEKEQINYQSQQQFSQRSRSLKSKLQEWKNNVLIIVPIKLGLDHINQEYFGMIKQYLQIESCVGFLGGKPKSALYIVGYQNNDFIFLDPHYVQSVVKPEKINKKMKTYHNDKTKKINFSKVDSSIAFGFFIKGRQSYLDLESQLKRIKEEYSGFITISDQDQYESLYQNVALSDNEELLDKTEKLQTTEKKFVSCYSIKQNIEMKSTNNQKKIEKLEEEEEDYVFI